MKILPFFAFLGLTLGAAYAEETASATTDVQVITAKDYVDAVFDQTHNAENITRNKLDPARLYIYGGDDAKQDNIPDSLTVAPGNDRRFDTLPVREAGFQPSTIEEEDGTKRVYVWVAETATE